MIVSECHHLQYLSVNRKFKCTETNNFFISCRLADGVFLCVLFNVVSDSYKSGKVLSFSEYLKRIKSVPSWDNMSGNTVRDVTGNKAPSFLGRNMLRTEICTFLRRHYVTLVFRQIRRLCSTVVRPFVMTTNDLYNHLS